jgi:hypothetical protein
VQPNHINSVALRSHCDRIATTLQWFVWFFGCFAIAVRSQCNQGDRLAIALMWFEMYELKRKRHALQYHHHHHHHHHHGFKSCVQPSFFVRECRLCSAAFFLVYSFSTRYNCVVPFVICYSLVEYATTTSIKRKFLIFSVPRPFLLSFFLWWGGVYHRSCVSFLSVFIDDDGFDGFLDGG